MRRYAPLLSTALILFLALAVLPSALNLPQTNPATTLEYAPVPPSDSRSDPPPGGNLTSLGLATSGSLAIAGDGDGPGAVGGLGPGGVGKSPRTKRCVGNPPRQTEDPLSPPCVAHFQGDNFGVTYQGVTREEIRVVIYADIYQYVTSRGVDNPPQRTYYDLAKPEGLDEPLFARMLRLLQRYFNDRYQTYDRFAHFYLYTYGGSAADRRRSDAADNYAKLKPFAVVTRAKLGNEDVYLEEMAKKGVMNFGSREGRDAAFFLKYPKLIWGYLPSVQQLAKQYSSWVCTRVVNRQVSFSGNAADTGKPRKLGLLRVQNNAFPGLMDFAKIVKQQITDCGGEFVAERTFPSVGYVANHNYPDQPTIAAQNMAAFQSAGVTTVIWAQGYETDHTKAGARVGYRPEWVVAGDGSLDGWDGDTYQDQSSWGHAWVLSNQVLEPAVEESPCYRAIHEADPSVSDQDVPQFCSLTSFYRDLRQLFDGVQVSGPRLQPNGIDKGFRAIPPIASRDPRLPACFYEAGDYTCVKDGVAMWWDTTTPPPNQTVPGCWRMPEGGRRYIAGSWPRQDVVAQKDASRDPCNGFGGTFTI